jgi:hypothetical protein
MNMTQYVTEIEFAATELLPVVWREQHEAVRLDAEISRADAQAESGYRHVAGLVLDDLDDEGIATLEYWETFFGPDKTASEGRRQRAESGCNPGGPPPVFTSACRTARVEDSHANIH